MFQHSSVDQGETVVVEVFRHDDPALEPLRQFDPRHGTDTTQGRSYVQVIADNIKSVTMHLNNLQAIGDLK